MCQTANQFPLASTASIINRRGVKKQLSIGQCAEQEMKNVIQSWTWKTAMAVVSATLLGAGTSSLAQQVRVLGVDISYWNCGYYTSDGISQANWTTGYTTGNRQFAQIRATRGGTTGVDQAQGPPGGGTLATLSRRYDDPRFIQNINRAT